MKKLITKFILLFIATVASNPLSAQLMFDYDVSGVTMTGTVKNFHFQNSIGDATAYHLFNGFDSNNQSGFGYLRSDTPDLVIDEQFYYYNDNKFKLTAVDVKSFTEAASGRDYFVVLSNLVHKKDNSIDRTCGLTLFDPSGNIMGSVKVTLPDMKSGYYLTGVKLLVTEESGNTYIYVLGSLDEFNYSYVLIKFDFGLGVVRSSHFRDLNLGFTKTTEAIDLIDIHSDQKILILGAAEDNSVYSAEVFTVDYNCSLVTSDTYWQISAPVSFIDPKNNDYFKPLGIVHVPNTTQYYIYGIFQYRGTVPDHPDVRRDQEDRDIVFVPFNSNAFTHPPSINPSESFKVLYTTVTVPGPNTFKRDISEIPNGLLHNTLDTVMISGVYMGGENWMLYGSNENIAALISDPVVYRMHLTGASPSVGCSSYEQFSFKGKFTHLEDLAVYSSWRRYHTDFNRGYLGDFEVGASKRLSIGRLTEYNSNIVFTCKGEKDDFFIDAIDGATSDSIDLENIDLYVEPVRLDMFNIAISNSQGTMCKFETGLLPPRMNLSTPKTNFANVKIYPVPAKDMLHISYDNSNEVQSLQVLNHLGQEVHAEFTHDGNEITMDISKLSQGIYLLFIKSSRGEQNIKFIKH